MKTLQLDLKEGIWSVYNRIVHLIIFFLDRFNIVCEGFLFRLLKLFEHFRALHKLLELASERGNFGLAARAKDKMYNPLIIALNKA